jgi:hypothetical protein
MSKTSQDPGLIPDLEKMFVKELTFATNHVRKTLEDLHKCEKAIQSLKDHMASSTLPVSLKFAPIVLRANRLDLQDQIQAMRLSEAVKIIPLLIGGKELDLADIKEELKSAHTELQTKVKTEIGEILSAFPIPMENTDTEAMTTASTAVIMKKFNDAKLRINIKMVQKLKALKIKEAKSVQDKLDSEAKIFDATEASINDIIDVKMGLALNKKNQNFRLPLPKSGVTQKSSTIKKKKQKQKQQSNSPPSKKKSPEGKQKQHTKQSKQKQPKDSHKKPKPSKKKSSKHRGEGQGRGK